MLQSTFHTLIYHLSAAEVEDLQGNEYGEICRAYPITRVRFGHMSMDLDLDLDPR